MKKAERQRIDAFELWCWRRLLRVPWTARRSNQSILKEISPGCSLEGMMLKLKLQYFGHLVRRVDSLEKTLMLGGIGGRRRRGRQRMRWLDGIQIRSDQISRSVVSDSLRPHESQHARPACPSPTPGVYSLMSIKSVMPSSHRIFCRPLFLQPPIPPSIRVFFNESTLHMRWPKYWSFSFSISPSNEHPGLIFRMDWLDLLAVQGTLKSLLQHHSSKASILRCSASSQSNSHIHM